MCEVNECKSYNVVTSRESIPNGVLPGAPQVREFILPNSTVEYIELIPGTTNSAQDAGVRIMNGRQQLYPFSSRDNNLVHVAGSEMFGILPGGGAPLRIPINRELKGPAYRLVFEYYNNTGAVMPVRVCIVTSFAKNKSTDQRLAETTKENAKV